MTDLAGVVAATQKGSSQLGLLIWVVLLGLVFFFLVIRPQRARNRQAQAVRSALVPGSQVLTTFGLYAEVVDIEEGGIVVLEVAPGVRSRYAAAVVARVIQPTGDAETGGTTAPGAHEEITDDEPTGGSDRPE